MDEYNVHTLWGLSPTLDITEFNTRLNFKRILQICPYDSRHTLKLLSSNFSNNIKIYVYEDIVENIARHILLIAIALDTNLDLNEKINMILKLHGNLLIDLETSKYLEEISLKLEELVSESRKIHGHKIKEENEWQIKMKQLFDFSNLTHKEIDSLIDTFNSYRNKFKNELIWEFRCRKYYGQKYDHIKNMVDWDYYMKLKDENRGINPKIKENGVSSENQAEGHIIRFGDFLRWRKTGIAYKTREKTLNHLNKTLISRAEGKRKEYKNRNLKDIGSSVSAKGYWGDILNPPYYCFGVFVKDDSLLKISNKRYVNDSIDIAKHNVKEILENINLNNNKIILCMDKYMNKIQKMNEYKCYFDFCYIGHCHISFIVKNDIKALINDYIIIEKVKNMSQLDVKQIEAFDSSIASSVCDQDWQLIKDHNSKINLIKEFILLQKNN